MISLLQQTAPMAVEVTTTEIVQTADSGTSAGMPQLDVSTFGNQIFWLLVTLAVIYWVLSRIALPRIAAVLANRQGAITTDLMAAEDLKLKAREAEAAYEQALTTARNEAQKIVETNRLAMQADLDAAIVEADKRIAARGAESEKRLNDIHASALENAREVARDVTGELLRSFGSEADASSIDAAVDQRLKGAAA